MAESTGSPKEPERLADDELGAVAGGKGSWRWSEEEYLQSIYQSRLPHSWDPFDQKIWDEVIGSYSKDDLIAREAWLRSDCPSTSTIIYYENGLFWED